jgi:hypothetical protein
MTFEDILNKSDINYTKDLKEFIEIIKASKFAKQYIKNLYILTFNKNPMNNFIFTKEDNFFDDNYIKLFDELKNTIYLKDKFLNYEIESFDTFLADWEGVSKDSLTNGDLTIIF